MPAEPPLTRWLRDEMPRRGYPLEGPRAGGITRLADEAGVSRASMSRIVSGQAEASVDALRKIGKVLGYSLVEMMIHAGMLDPDEMGSTGPLQAHADAVPPQPEIPPEVSLQDLPDWERRLWLTPGLTVDERQTAIHLIRFLRGAATPDEIDISVLEELWHTLGAELIKRHKQRRSNGTHQAS